MQIVVDPLSPRRLLFPSMGMNGLLSALPGGSMEASVVGFSKVRILRNKNHPTDIDTGTLFTVVVRLQVHKDSCEQRGLRPCRQ